MKKTFLISFLILSNLFTSAQISIKKSPISSTYTLTRDIPTISIQPPNLAVIELEDNEANLKGKPYRYAKLIDCDIDPYNSGKWEELDNGIRVWRLKITSEGAKALSLYFDAFWIPTDGELYIYNSDKSKILGAYTSINNHSSGYFANELIEDQELILEYVQKGKGQPILHIHQVSYAYRSVGTEPQLRNFGDSGECEVNVNCSPEGDDWQDVKTAVCRLSINIGNNGYWCSGSLINNTAEDCKPYVLTADHCTFDEDNNVYASAGEMNQWIFYFNYESDGCENPSSNPSSNTMVGCSKVSNSSANGNINNTSDFHLVELNNSLPYEYGLYVAGWNRSSSAASNGVGIHHPSGDIKKISTFSQSATSSGTDWRVRWSETSNGRHGVTEGGSSGSPLLNSDKQIVGDLSTGSSYCDFLNGYDFYGKFSYSWDQNGNQSIRQLKPWLDPINSGVTSLNSKLCGSPLMANFMAVYTYVATGQPTQFFYTGTGNPTSYSWTFYGAGVNPSSSVDVAPIVTYNNNGQYTVRLDVNDGTNDSYEIKSSYILVDENGGSIDINEQKEETSLNVFPNPSTGIVYLSYQKSYAQLNIYNLLGKIVYQDEFLQSKKLDLSSLDNGVYFLEVYDENFSTTQRLIINR
jgi:hypothetical protein